MSDNRPPSSDISKFYNLTAYNNYMYARSQGYDFKYLVPTLASEKVEEYLVCRNPVTKNLRHAAWAKILSVYKELPNYDTVIYLDSDAYFNNKACVYERSGYASGAPPVKFLKDIPWNETANTGFIMADNEAETFRFLKRWYWAKETDDKYDVDPVFEQHFAQTIEDPAFTVLDINQIKLNFGTEDAKRHRPIINHVTGRVVINQYDVIRSDVERVYGLHWFSEVMAYLEKTCEEYSTDAVIAKMNNAQLQLQTYCNSMVISGPFEGLSVLPSSHWWGGDIMAKWLGTYEEPIHLVLKAELAENHDMFVNVGCGDGYYGAGVGFKNKHSELVLFDIAPECSSLVKDICSKNNITNYSFSHDSSAENISRYLKKAKNPWLLMDIEGGEAQLLDPLNIPELKYTTIIVEAHDFNVPDITNELRARFERTHCVVNIADTLTRNLTALPAYIELDQKTRELIRTENRPTRMNWLYMIPTGV